MESFSNIAFSPLLLSWLTKSCSSVWASTKQRMELAQEGQLWMQRHCGSVCELCCPDWRAQWNDAVNFGACNLVFTVLVRLGGWSVWGVWASPQLWGVSLGHLFGGDKCPRKQWELFTISPLQTVQVWVSSGTNSDFATSMFSFSRGDGRDVLPLVRGRRRAELLVVCILPLRLRFTFSILEIF